jgi:serine phosphatase RsbU (regulator of sigma subunit)/PAS domain-containing protein
LSRLAWLRCPDWGLATSTDDAHLARLTALVARQRRELDELHRDAAARSVADVASGILMERLGCSAAEASAELTRIAAESGTPVTEFAAEVAGLVPAAATPSGEPGEARQAWLASVAVAGTRTDLTADGSALAAAMLAQTLAEAGAVAVALFLIAPDGAIELAGAAGLGPGEASRWRRMPPGIGALAEQAATSGTEFWWPDGRPDGDSSPLLGNWDYGARVVVPLLTSAGRSVGSLEVCWPTGIGEFPPPLSRQLLALAELAANALGPGSLGAGAPGPGAPGPGALAAGAGGRDSWLLGLLDSLHESVLVAPAMRDANGVITDFRIVHVSQDFRDPAGRQPADLTGQSLIEAYPAAAMSGGLYHRAVEVLLSGTPQHVSGEVIGTGSGIGQVAIASVRIARLFDGVVIVLRHAAEADRQAALLQHAQRLGRFGGWEENLATGAVHWTPAMFPLFGVPADEPIPLVELPSLVHQDDQGAAEAFSARLLEDKVPTASMFRVRRRDDASIRQLRAFAEPVTDHYGELVAVRGAYQDVSTHYHTELALAATRDLLSDTQERADEEHRLALRLQRAITPQSSHLAQAAGLDVAARYRPAGQGHLVSGDWYDTVLLPSKQVMLVVGDVAGHGIDAVTGMVALRNCLRGLAITAAGPATLLSWLNQVAYHLTDDVLATAICGLYDPESCTLRWARAGHLPAVLVRAGRAQLLPQPRGVLLGADAKSGYAEETTPLQLGDTLLMFTDGLIERRDQSIDASIDALLEIASRPVTDIDAYADLLVAHGASDTQDDACLIAVTLR